jgi:hypothetical protein
MNGLNLLGMNMIMVEAEGEAFYNPLSHLSQYYDKDKLSGFLTAWV